MTMDQFLDLPYEVHEACFFAALHHGETNEQCAAAALEEVSRTVRPKPADETVLEVASYWRINYSPHCRGGANRLIFKGGQEFKYLKIHLRLRENFARWKKGWQP
jgi:hypothetical protein